MWLCKDMQGHRVGNDHKPTAASLVRLTLPAMNVRQQRAGTLSSRLEAADPAISVVCTHRTL